MLFIAVYFVNKGSVKAFLVWSGVLLYLIYAYVIYAFDVHFNSLFLVYVAILGLSFYALIGSLLHLYLNQLQASFSANTKVTADAAEHCHPLFGAEANAPRTQFLAPWPAYLARQITPGS